jgi:hypothetical protein
MTNVAAKMKGMRQGDTLPKPVSDRVSPSRLIASSPPKGPRAALQSSCFATEYNRFNYAYIVYSICGLWPPALSRGAPRARLHRPVATCVPVSPSLSAAVEKAVGANTAKAISSGAGSNGRAAATAGDGLPARARGTLLSGRVGQVRRIQSGRFRPKARSRLASSGSAMRPRPITAAGTFTLGSADRRLRAIGCYDAIAIGAPAPTLVRHCEPEIAPSADSNDFCGGVEVDETTR